MSSVIIYLLIQALSIEVYFKKHVRVNRMCSLYRVCDLPHDLNNSVGREYTRTKL